MKNIIFLTILLFSLPAAESFAQNDEPGSLRHPIVDSRMTKEQAFEGLAPNCPKAIRDRQKIVKVKYSSFDDKIHEGQIILDKDLARDIKAVFRLALAERFPIYSVIPVADPKFRKNERWDDDLSMAADNSSGFNYREKTGGGSLSNHAYGRAVDLNTFQNPYVKGTLVLPPTAAYNPAERGTFTAGSPIVKLFNKLGWQWGGTWTTRIDYQHFEKPLKQEGKKK